MADDIDLTAAIGREPEEIVQYFEEKGYNISWNWRDTWKEANAKAFTVAAAMRMDVLKTIRSSVETAIKEGKTFREFKGELEPALRKKGWWGRKEIVNEETGEVEERELGSVRRLRTIYRTNTQTSYNAGRWKSQQASSRELLEYIAVLDQNTRPTHRAADGVVLPKDHPWWKAHYPPNGWGCRCRARSRSRRQVSEEDITDEEALEPFASEGWDYNPGEAAFQPDLESYNYRVARGYVQGVLTGPKFDRMHSRLRSAIGDYQEENPDASAQELIEALRGEEDVVEGEELPVGVLDEEYRDMFDTEAQTVRLSDETLLKQVAKRPGLTASDYAKVQAVLEAGQLIVKDKDLHRVFIREEGRLYRAVVKVTEDRSELYLVSYRRTNADDVERTRSRGQVILDDLDLNA
jgi:SPP1 gp7 family putative phage head morphogenesis protein